MTTSQVEFQQNHPLFVARFCVSPLAWEFPDLPRASLIGTSAAEAGQHLALALWQQIPSTL